ncbi:hypothetical protein [Luteibacter sp. CQ10]|uniref:hypothetical protein n=1 Tax=Luteibacter sp. CQ10 TaxID=2805821 RepID=UPI0034A523C9
MTIGSSFRLLMRVDVRHDFFADGYARHLVFKAHAGTEAFLKRFGSVLRNDDSTLAVGVDHTRMEGMWSERMEEGEPRVLRFDLHCGDPVHGYYTAPVTASHPETEEDGTVAACVDVSSGETGRVNRPLATLALPLVPDGIDSLDVWSSSAEARYTLRLRSPRTVWKYVLTGDWQDRKLSIVDARGEVTFSAVNREVLPDGQTVLVARSTTGIELRERPPQRFQLQDISTSTERILISRLPGAAPQRLWRETVEGEPTVVSEIFVHS